jgi:cytochrome c oxidase accessory protein FixG
MKPEPEAALDEPIFAAPPGRVLSTLNLDGTRRLLSPQPSPGRWLNARRVVGFSLLALFVTLPLVSVGKRPAVLLAFDEGRFTFFGTTFGAADAPLLLCGLLAFFLLIFFVSAWLGRVFCGWACPQTVCLELVFRPLERLLEGGASRKHLKTPPARIWRTGLKWVLFAVLSLLLTLVFVAYFTGSGAVFSGAVFDPSEHPVAFGTIWSVSALLLIDFGRFREQTCTVVCPYGRFQSVLLDRRSLIVGYDVRRGEPRGKPGSAEILGDCVDCGACVRTCPTGIDIRDGLQMECIHCTQCIDACDAIMDRVGKARGLVRYTSRDEIEGVAETGLRWRLVLYPVLLGLALVACVALLIVRAPASVTMLRKTGAPFQRTQTGEVTNQIRLKVTNRTLEDRRYQISLVDGAGLKLVAPVNPLPVAAGQSEITSVFVVFPQEGFVRGERSVRLRLTDSVQWEETLTCQIQGPTGPASGGR